MSWSFLLQRQLGDGVLHRLSVQHPRLLEDDVSFSIEQDQSRDRADPVSNRQLSPDASCDWESQHLSLSFQISFEPVHDGLGR